MGAHGVLERSRSRFRLDRAASGANAFPREPSAIAPRPIFLQRKFPIAPPPLSSCSDKNSNAPERAERLTSNSFNASVIRELRVSRLPNDLFKAGDGASQIPPASFGGSGSWEQVNSRGSGRSLIGAYF